MPEIKKHSLRVTIGTAISVVAFLIVWSIKFGGYINIIETNSKDIQSTQSEVKTMNMNMMELKTDIKRLVNNEKSK